MKSYFLFFVLVSLVAVGCGKSASQHADVNPDGLTVLEADALLSESAGSKAVLPMPANFVVNKDAGPLVEKTVKPVKSERVVTADAPDDISIQKALSKAGFYKGALDGKIGPKTKEAIREFQRRNNLSVDGRVGPKTWAVLKEYLAEPAAGTSQF